MRAAGATVEQRPWRPHLTIGRWRPSPERDAAAQRAEMALADYAGPAFEVQELQLVHSVIGPQPEYRDLHVVRLSTGGD